MWIRELLVARFSANDVIASRLHVIRHMLIAATLVFSILGQTYGVPSRPGVIPDVKRFFIRVVAKVFSGIRATLGCVLMKHGAGSVALSHLMRSWMLR